MRYASLLLNGLVALASVCCGNPTLPAPAPPEHAAASREIEQGHLLLFPMADAEDLLGRPVKVTDDGAWSMADARKPGCEVAVRRVPSSYRVQRTVQIESLTAFSATFGKLIGVEAGFGSATEAEIDIHNTSVLKASTRGDCENVFVDQVFVGTGRRTLLAKAHASGKASLIVPGAPGAGADTRSKIVDETAWDSEQAYAFTFRQAAREGELAVSVDMPSTVSESESVQVKIRVNHTAYLVVYYLDAQGTGAVLWPSRQEPEPLAEPGQAIELPSKAERAAGIALQAALSEPGKLARETLVVYAFRDKADFTRLTPPPGESSERGAEYAARLTRLAGEIPLSRWSRAMLTYVIKPRRAQR